MPLEKRDLQKCIHCGLCLQACPTFLATGQEAESPRGRIYLMRSVQEGRMDWNAVRPHIDACMGCLGCQTACPSGVPYAKLIESARAEVERHARSPFQRWVRYQTLFQFTSPPHLYRLLRTAHLLRIKRMPKPLARLLGAHESAVQLPKLPPKERRRWRDQIQSGVGNGKGRAGLLLGCAMSVLFPHVHRATLQMLKVAGYQVEIPRRQGCCGALWVHNGYPQMARRLARRLFRAFADVDIIVVNAAGCGSTMKEYPLLFAGTPLEAEARRFAQRVRDISELLAETDLPEPTNAVRMTATLHDACHLVHGQGIREQPRQLLSRIPALRIVEMDSSDLCCGSAGIYNLLQPALAKDALQRKVSAIQRTGAEAVVSANPGCTLWISQGLQEAGTPKPVYHPVELLAQAYGEPAFSAD